MGSIGSSLRPPPLKGFKRTQIRFGSKAEKKVRTKGGGGHKKFGSGHIHPRSLSTMTVQSPLSEKLKTFYRYTVAVEPIQATKQSRKTGEAKEYPNREGYRSSKKKGG